MTFCRQFVALHDDATTTLHAAELPQRLSPPLSRGRRLVPALSA